MSNEFTASARLPYSAGSTDAARAGLSPPPPPTSDRTAWPAARFSHPQVQGLGSVPCSVVTVTVIGTGTQMHRQVQSSGRVRPLRAPVPRPAGRLLSWGRKEGWESSFCPSHFLPPCPLPSWSLGHLLCLSSDTHPSVPLSAQSSPRRPAPGGQGRSDRPLLHPQHRAGAWQACRAQSLDGRFPSRTCSLRRVWRPAPETPRLGSHVVEPSNPLYS